MDSVAKSKLSFYKKKLEHYKDKLDKLKGKRNTKTGTKKDIGPIITTPGGTLP